MFDLLLMRYNIVRIECGGIIMSKYLPGNTCERLRELRESRGLSKNKLADLISINRNTYGRIEDGSSPLKNDELIALAEFYDVPTDFILGLVDSPEKTYYEISELGLTVDAAKVLYNRQIDVRVLNELLINEKFIKATNMMAIYFSESISDSIRVSNRLKDFMYDYVDEMIQEEKIPRNRETIALQNGLKTSKEPPEHYDTERIQKQILLAVKEIKDKIDSHVKEKKEERRIIEEKVLQAMRKEAPKALMGKNLNRDQQIKRLTEVTKNALSLDPEITPEMLEELTPAIVGIYDSLSKYGKK